MYRASPTGEYRQLVAPLAAQISLVKMRELSVHKHPIYLKLEPARALLDNEPERQASSPQRCKPYMEFLFVVSHVCTQASSRPTLASQPLPSASGYNDLYECISVLPQGTCTP